MTTDDRTADPLDRRVRDAFQRQSNRIAVHVDARAGLEHLKEPSTMVRRNLKAALAGAALIVLVTGAVVLFNPFDGGDDLAGPSSTTSTSEARSSTTEPVTSTTDSAISTTTSTTPPEEWDDGRYLVVGVAADDVLNVRDNPGASHPIVGTLAPGERVLLDGYSAMSEGSEWRSVLLEDGTIGWVNATFLAPPPGWEVPLEGVPCRPDGPEYGGTQTVAGSAPGDGAGNVLEVSTYHSAECDRIVMCWGRVRASPEPAGRPFRRPRCRPVRWCPVGARWSKSGYPACSMPGPSPRPLRQSSATCLPRGTCHLPRVERPWCSGPFSTRTGGRRFGFWTPLPG